MAMNGHSAIDALAEFAVGASAQGREARLTLHLADAVMARIAGAGCEEGVAMLRLYENAGTGLLGRVAADASITRLTEIDDIHRPTCITIGALTAPVALAFAGPGTNASTLLSAFLAGQEIALRVAHALGGARLIMRGLWPSLLVAPIGAAATAGRLLGLPPARMRQALALAVAQVPRVPGRFIGARPGRWLLFGEAVRSGAMAALAAADGVDGDPALLDPAWLRAVGGDLADPARLMPDEMLSDAISIKPHPSAKQALTSIHGLRQMLAEAGVSPDRVEAVEVHVPPPYASMLDREPARTSRLASLISAPWQLALTALRPELLDDVKRAAWPDDARLEAFAARVRVIADPSLDKSYPAVYPARLVVRAGAVRLDRLITDSPGDPALPFDVPQLLDKARRIFGGAGAGQEAVQRALRLPSDDAALPTLRALLGYADGPGTAARFKN